jgi:hypothetical protein
MTAPTKTAQGRAAEQAKRRAALIEDYEWLIEHDPRIHEEMAAARLGVTTRTVTRIKAAIKARDESAGKVAR